MKCQILFSGKNKKNVTNLSSADLAQRVVKVNTFWSTEEIISVVFVRNFFTFFFFSDKLTFTNSSNTDPIAPEGAV